MTTKRLETPRLESLAPSLLTVVALTGLLAGCGREPKSRQDAPGTGGPGTGGPNLVFIVSDTLRADAIDCDAHRDRTPNLCEIVDRGVLFENAYAGGPWTLPSSVALFSGNHATAYGQLAPGSAADWSERDEFFRIADEEVLLAEALVERGYEALRFNEGMLPGEANAFQGLDEHELVRPELITAIREHYPDSKDWESERMPLHDLGVLRFLAEGPENPFFLLLWIINPHAPYNPPGGVPKELAEGLTDLRHPVEFYPQLGHLHRPREGFRELRRHAPFTDDEIEMIVGLYLAEVHSVDERIGRFVELLEARGLLEDTVIVLTSDHGEGFGEHERFLHGNSFYEELLHIPLLMAGPGLPSGVRVGARVPSIDVMPTLCDVLGAGCMQDTEGRSLRPLFTGEAEDTGRPLYATAPMRYGLRDSLIDGDYKLIVSKEGLELYDLAQDPGETKNLVDELPDVVDRMRDELREVRRSNERRRKQNQELITDAGREETQEGTLEQMRALGYID